MNVHPFASNSPRSFNAYRRGEFDVESLTFRNPKRTKSSEFRPTVMLKSFANYIKYHYKLHSYLVFFLALLFGVVILFLLLSYKNRNQTMRAYKRADVYAHSDSDSDSDSYPFSKLKNLVMVAGHSVYTSSNCGKFDNEDSWLLESYQKHPGQAATFIGHIKEGVETAAKDDASLLLFSGGETRKDASPRSEAQSYWLVADSYGWFESMRGRALTEEHARDSFENLLFSVCRFRELTGAYPQNITVVSYDFKEERFAGLHRSAIGFPESRFSYVATFASATARESARKGEAVVRAQFENDPYGCTGSLHRKKLRRDPFHRWIPYPNGCPEIKALFRNCGTTPYSGPLPWGIVTR